jgi:hypothetical protein
MTEANGNISSLTKLIPLVLQNKDKNNDRRTRGITISFCHCFYLCFVRLEVLLLASVIEANGNTSSLTKQR